MFAFYSPLSVEKRTLFVTLNKAKGLVFLKKDPSLRSERHLSFLELFSDLFACA
jgi:hypothetical protein